MTKNTLKDRGERNVKGRSNDLQGDLIRYLTGEQ